MSGALGALGPGAARRSPWDGPRSGGVPAPDRPRGGGDRGPAGRGSVRLPGAAAVASSRRLRPAVPRQELSRNPSRWFWCSFGVRGGRADAPVSGSAVNQSGA